MRTRSLEARSPGKHREEDSHNPSPGDSRKVVDTRSTSRSPGDSLVASQSSGNGQTAVDASSPSARVSVN